MPDRSALMRPPRGSSPDPDTDPAGLAPPTCGGHQRPCGARGCPHCGTGSRPPSEPPEQRAARILVEVLRQAEAPDALFIGAPEREHRRLAVAWGALVERVVCELEQRRTR